MMLEKVRRNPDLPTFWRNPFHEMERFFDDDFFAPFSNMGRFFDRDRWLPAMDVREQGDTYLVSVELPGLSKDDVEVTVEDNVLTVRGERRWESKEDDGDKSRVHRVERSYGKFVRSFTLPRTVQAEEVKAEFKDGVLNLTLPKAEEAKSRRVEIA